MDEKILDRIQKLLALATSPNVHEAAAAYARAQALATKHEVDLAQLQVDTPGAQDEEVQDHEVFRERSLIPWKAHLAAGIADANGCKVYTRGLLRRDDHKKVSDTCHVIGTATSVATVRYMYAYLVREVDRLAAANREGHDRTWLTAFRLGCVAIISRRLVEARKEVLAEASARAAQQDPDPGTPGLPAPPAPSGAALTIIDRNVARVAERYASLNLKEGTDPTVRDEGGFEAGIRAGRTVALGAGPGLGAGAKGELKGQ